jgi:hypothetical protein
MPSFLHSKDTVIKIATVERQGIFKDIEVPQEFEALDTTAFGDGAKTYIAGLQDGSFSLTGMYSRTEFNALIALNGTIVAVEYHPEGTATPKPKATFNALITKMAPKSAVGAVIELGIDMQITGGVTWGAN